MKIIAEIGSNIRNLDDCFKSIDGAKRCGANIVKFQLIEKGDLWHSPEKTLLHKNWVPLLADYCKKKEIEFACTAFNAQSYVFIDRFVQRHKIASCEVTDLEILETVNSFRKPTIISTGCLKPFDLKNYTIPMLKDVDLTIMFCVSEYPAQVIDVSHLALYQRICGSWYTYGFSDHSTDALIIPRKMQFHGVSVIEKHVNFIEGLESDDSPHSLNEKSFGLMVRQLRDQPIHLDETFYTKTFENYLRRPIAIKNIAQGEKIKLGENIKYHRSKGQSCPKKIGEGLHANQRILIGEEITDDNVS